MDKLMDKLVMAKAIMDKTEGLKSAPSRNLPQSRMTEDYNIPAAKYNIPSEYLAEAPQQTNQYETRTNTKPVGQPSVDAIKNSRLPDEIKKLMIEHPIAQPQSQQVTLSDDLIKKAAALMKNEGSYVPEAAKQKNNIAETSNKPTKSAGQIDYSLIKEMIEDAVTNALRENGLLVESAERSNEVFSFKVGKHMFEGKVTKIKKLS
jgi:hypothetical protein